MGLIYCCENLTNGKKYVGQTIRTLKERQEEHYRKAWQEGVELIFSRAIRKYGTMNFKWTILEECPDDQLNEREQYWITKLDTYYINNKGYNMTQGGDNTSIQSTKRVRVYKINEDNTISEYAIFNSTRETGRELSKQTGEDFQHSRIGYICSGKGYSYHGFTFCFIDENNKDIPTGFKRNNKRISIVAINISTGEETEFPSIRQASIQLKLNDETIKRKLDNHTEYKGYTFKYK